jgi:hypothetical protein
MRAAGWAGDEAEWDTRVAAAAWVSSYLVNICAEYKPRLVGGFIGLSCRGLAAGGQDRTASA